MDNFVGNYNLEKYQRKNLNRPISPGSNGDSCPRFMPQEYQGEVVSQGNPPYKIFKE